MKEYDLIRMIGERFPRSPRQRNEMFACDAELVKIAGRLWAFTLDDFSPEEDLFTSDDPERLGATLVTATLSDLLAAGALPQFFMPAVALPKDVDAAFVEGISEGVRSALEEADCFLIGGDLGTAETWRFCGFAFGPIDVKNPLTRVLREGSQDLWVTGCLGDANLAALRGEPTPRFELRMEEAKLIRRYATACIDTSGGLLDAVYLLHAQSPPMRFTIDVDKVPLAPGLVEFAGASGFPPEAALLGGAGEYELLFATSADLPEAATAELASAGATFIGTVGPHEEPGLYFQRNAEVFGKMTEPPPCPRDAATVEKHIEEVMQAARRMFASGRQ